MSAPAALVGAAMAALAILAPLTWEPAGRRPGSGPPRGHPARSLGAKAERVLDRLVPARVARRRDAQLPALLDRLAAARRAGSSLAASLAELGPTSPPPLGIEMQAVAAALRHGRTIDQALAAWATLPSGTPDLELATAALRLSAQAGGEVARAIDRTAATLRERRSLQREVHSLATQARASAVVLVAAPGAFTALVATIQPSVLRFLFTTPAGLACVGVGAGLDALGATWMARIVRRAT